MSDEKKVVKALFLNNFLAAGVELPCKRSNYL